MHSRRIEFRLFRMSSRSRQLCGKRPSIQKENTLLIMSRTEEEEEEAHSQSKQSSTNGTSKDLIKDEETIFSSPSKPQLAFRPSLRNIKENQLQKKFVTDSVQNNWELLQQIVRSRSYLQLKDQYILMISCRKNPREGTETYFEAKRPLHSLSRLVLCSCLQNKISNQS